MKSILFLILLVTGGGLTVTDPPLLKEMELNAGNEFKIPCKLWGVKLTWYWIPRYPICADIQGDQEQEIFSVISSHRLIKIDQFQRRLQMTPTRINGSLILTVQFHHMNDSGIFYCSNYRTKSSLISVVVKSDDQSGMEVEMPKNSSQEKGVIALTCKPCKDKSEADTDESSSIIWTRNGKDASSHGIRKLRNKLKIENKPQNYGLWRCHRPKCPTQSDGYCLEKYFGTSGKSEIEETTWSIPVSPDANKRIKNQIIIGSSVIGLLSLLAIWAVGFAICYRRQSQRTSKTAEDSKSQEIKHSAENSPRRHGKKEEEKMDEGTKGIQYSVLQFKEPEHHQDPTGQGTPTVIYTEMSTDHFAKT